MSVKLGDFLLAMERVAPRELALSFDNPGLLIQPDHDEISRVLVALDCTVAVANEARELGADLVLTHHPLFFHPVQRLAYDDPATAAACMLLRHGVGLFTAHTNLDAAQGGVNDTLCDLFGIEDIAPFDDGMGRVGTLAEPETLGQLARRAERTLDTSVRFVGDENALVRRVATVGGSGGSDVLPAAQTGADVLITGEVKHSDALDALTLGLGLIVAGHYETERVVLEPWICRLQNDGFDVQYTLSRADGSPFARFQEGTP